MNLSDVKQIMPTVMVASLSKYNGTGVLHKSNVAQYAVKHGNKKAREKYNISRYTLDSYMAEYKKGVY